MLKNIKHLDILTHQVNYIHELYNVLNNGKTVHGSDKKQQQAWGCPHQS
jgi:hypothetical protein